MIAIAVTPPNEMAPKQTPTKRVERNCSDWTIESNTGWESGNDDDDGDGESTTDLNLTDHPIEELDLSKNTGNHKFSCFSTKTKMKLKNPWKKPDSIQRTDSFVRTTQNPCEDICNTGKKVIHSSRKDIPRIVKTASIRGKEIFRIAGKDLVRSASKRSSQASRDKVVVEPSGGPHEGNKDVGVILCLGTTTHIEAIYESKDTTTTTTITTAKHGKVGQVMTPTKSEHSSSTSNAASISNIFTITDRIRNIDTPSQREPPQKVPSYIPKMWQEQRIANTKMMLQWAIWEVQVDELSKPPSLQPWISISPSVQSEETRQCSRTKHELK